jgi:hypothetical protein
MFRRLIDWYIDRLVAKERLNLPAINWRSLLDGISEEIQGSAVFLETRGQRFVPVDSLDSNSEGSDIVSLVVTWSHDGVEPWETKEPAKNLAQALSERDAVVAVVLLSRSLDSFVGYYVRIRPKLP